ncbi:MAG: energy transducer TonB [Betaproteobacteria bacterium]|nr:energy transducer TonB [Betaproteobacteria bacterium]
MMKKSPFLWILLISITLHISFIWLLLHRHTLPRINPGPMTTFEKPIELSWSLETPPQQGSPIPPQPTELSSVAKKSLKKNPSVPTKSVQAKETSRDINKNTDIITESLKLAKQLDISSASDNSKILNTLNSRNALVIDYESNFRDKVERIGSVNYPAPVNGRPLSGNVRVSVVINSDGHIQELLIIRSSGVSELDQAALKIIRLCDPFPPFSKSMKAVTDAVRITRTFVFRQSDESVLSR